MPDQKNAAQQPMASTNAGIKAEESSLQEQLQSIDWDSERQLISSLSKLQELESRIHELRSLLPDRLLAPVNPIVNPRRSGLSNPIPQNPQALNTLLRKSATEGVKEVNSFKDLWLSPEMQATWSRVEQKLAENNGLFPQPSALWSRDYEVLLKEMDKEKENGAQGLQAPQQPDSVSGQKQQQQPPPPPIYGTTEIEREGGWKLVVESFQKRQIPGFRIASGRNESMVYVNLGLAGIIFEIQEVLSTAKNNSVVSTFELNVSNPTLGGGTKQALPEWRVSTYQSLGKTGPSRLETAIVQELNSRTRKWDLHYLLELILAYSDIHSKPCHKCNRLTDSSAQLPVVRKLAAVSAATATTSVNAANPAQAANTSTGNEMDISWEAYHTGCA